MFSVNVHPGRYHVGFSPCDLVLLSKLLERLGVDLGERNKILLGELSGESLIDRRNSLAWSTPIGIN